MASLHQDDNLIREAFHNRANKEQKIDTNDMDELLEELSEALGVDCKPAQEVFGSSENKEKSQNDSPSKAK